MSPAKKQNAALRATLATLAALPLPRLRAQYEHAFGKPAGKTPRDRLVRALAERATGTAKDTTATAKPSSTATPKGSRKPGTPPKPPRKPATTVRDPRLPAPGTVLERAYKGKTYRVEVLERGFKHDGREWRSLTAVALAVTGYKAISGTLFFGIAQPAAKPPTTAKAPRKGPRKQG